MKTISISKNPEIAYDQILMLEMNRDQEYPITIDTGYHQVYISNADMVKYIVLGMSLFMESEMYKKVV